MSRINRRRILKYGLGATVLATTHGNASISTRKEFDCIVLGLGAIGSGALYWLSRRMGERVLGIEQFELGHSRGSGQDHSRATHYQYADPRLVKLGAQAIDTWRLLEADTGERVFVPTGGVELCGRGSEFEALFEQIHTAVDSHGLPVEEIDAAECMRRFPQFRLSDAVRVLHFTDTGLADANKGNAAHIRGAQRNGAQIHTHTRVLNLAYRGEEIEVHTEKGIFVTGQLVLAAGPWGQRWLQRFGLELPLKVFQSQVTYFTPSDLDSFAVGSFPIFHLFGGRHPYGFPVYGEAATKAGIDDFNTLIHPDHRTFDADEDAEAALAGWANTWIPGYAAAVLYTKTCLITYPEDRLCILDQIPGIPQVSFAVGAGMSYKFASLFGKIMSELVIDGSSPHDYSPVTLARPDAAQSRMGRTIHPEP